MSKEVVKIILERMISKGEVFGAVVIAQEKKISKKWFARICKKYGQEKGNLYF